MNSKELIEKGYTIENAKITQVDLSMADHGVMCPEIWIEGSGWACCYGSYCIGKGYLGSKDFSGSKFGIEAIMRLMNAVGVSRFNDMKDKYVRVATKGVGSTVFAVGNIVDDRWFSFKDFFENKSN